MQVEEIRDTAVAALEDIKARDIVVLEVKKLTALFDYMIVASGTSNRHVKALADAVAEKAKEAGQKPVGIEGENGSEWVLIDLQDALVHVMLPRVREFYNLEKLWSIRPSSDALAKNG